MACSTQNDSFGSSVLYRMILVTFVILLSITKAHEQSDTVIGCGGSIRWDASSVSTAKLPFEKVKVNLYAESSNSLKDVTEVLPNGAFWIPLYDPSRYRLTISTPKGWKYSPIDGHVIDLRANSDACMQDFNFGILGFTVFGQVVTFGLDTGPSGLTVRLYARGTTTMHAQSLTEKNGHFSISPVTPGSYDMTVSDGEARGADHIRAKTQLIVDTDSLTLKTPIVLSGHFVRGGAVDALSQPLTGNKVYLLADTSTGDVTRIDCQKLSSPSDQVMLKLPLKIRAQNYKIVCETKIDIDGQFSFDRLPGGRYVVWSGSDEEESTPSSVVLAFKPVFREILVEHTDIDLGRSTFRVDRIKLPAGRITWPNGESLSSAEVQFGEHVIQTDKDGFYQPGFVKPNHYTIKVRAEGAQFLEVTVHLDGNPTTNRLPSIQPDKVAVCGRIESAELATSSLSPNMFKASLVLVTKATGEHRREAVPLLNGKLAFCLYAAPGDYELKADVKIGDHEVHFTPTSLQVQLTGPPVNNLVFAQFRAKITGRVTCLQSPCVSSDRQLTIRLVAVDQPEMIFLVPLVPTKTNSAVAHFELELLLPRDYHLDLVHRDAETNHVEPIDGWCWTNPGSSEKAELSTSSTRVLRIRYAHLHWEKESALDLTHRGYAVKVQLESPIRMNRLPPILLQAIGSVTVGNETKSLATMDWLVDQRENMVCLPSPTATYRFQHTSPCLRLSMTGETVHPVRQCHARLGNSPVIHLKVEQVPVHVHMAFTEAFAPSEHKLLTGQSVQIEWTERAPDGSVVKTETVFAKWAPTDQPSAKLLLWLNPKHTLELKPLNPLTKGLRWSYTYILDNTDSISVKPLAIQPSGTPTPGPLLTHSQTVFSKPDPFDAQCANLFPEQTVSFQLGAAVFLRGQIQPAAAKVEVELVRKEPTTPSMLTPQKNSNSEEPLIPIHAELQPSTTTDEPSPTPTHTYTTLTDPMGVFIFGPVPLWSLVGAQSTNELLTLPNPRDLFTVRLMKPGYEFTEQEVGRQSKPSSPPTDGGGGAKSREEVSNWVFKATKLSLVEVIVTEGGGQGESKEQRSPLAGVLVSIIGEGHRGNRFTDARGLANFVGLAPGVYYIRAMMKEHVFAVTNPKAERAGQASPITIIEGVSVRVEIAGQRVAYSASGMVTSLDRVPMDKVLVEAIWLPELPAGAVPFSATANTTVSCQLGSGEMTAVPREESITVASGEFRIRGLKPGCLYAIAVHRSVTEQASNAHTVDEPRIARAIPSVIHLIVPAHDVSGLRFIAIPHIHMSTLTVDVDTDDEYIGKLQLKLFPLDRPDLVLATHNFADSLLFSLPGSKMDQIVGRDIVVRLEGSFDSQFYTGVGPQQVVLNAEMDVSEHHTFVFRPKTRSLFPDMARNEL